VEIVKMVEFLMMSWKRQVPRVTVELEKFTTE
jgi:hypothetical protein